MPKQSRKKNYRMTSSVAPVPNQLLTKMKYCTQITLNAGLGTPAAHLFRANSIFDPDQTGVGHQPLGHDELSSFYDKYTVLDSRISINAISSTASAGAVDNYMIGISLNDDSTPITTQDTIREQPRTVYRMLGPSNGGAAKVRMSKTYKASSFYGLQDSQDDPAVGALIGSNPDKTAFFSVWQEGNSGGNASTAYVYVDIEYTVLFSEPKQLAQS